MNKCFVKYIFLPIVFVQLMVSNALAQTVEVFNEDFTNAKDWVLEVKDREGIRTAWRIGEEPMMDGPFLCLSVWDTLDKDWYCGYDAFSENQHGIIASRKIDARSFKNLSISFDWKAGGEQYDGNFYDYGLLGYSLDDGLTYTWLDYGAVEGKDHKGYYVSPNGPSEDPLRANFKLPEAVYGKEFLLTFRWNNDGEIDGSPGWMIDDISIEGLPDWGLLGIVYEDDFSCNKGWDLGNGLIDSVQNRTVWNISNACNLGLNKSLTINKLSNETYSCGYFENIGNTQGIIATKTVDAQGMQNLILLFDWKAEGEWNDNVALDYGEIGYSRDGGNTFTWIAFGGKQGNGRYYDQPNFKKQELIGLPQNLEDTTFVLAIKWIHNNKGEGDKQGFSIDNLKIFGANKPQNNALRAEKIYKADALPQINRVKIDALRLKGISDESFFNFPNPYGINTVAKFYDGLGRLVQTVNQGSSPNFKDLVEVVEYDVYGRMAQKFLPYEDPATNAHSIHKLNALDDQAIFYKNNPEDHVNTSMPYAKTEYEPSPLNRVAKQGFPGEEWQPNANPDRSIRTVRLLNDRNDEVRDFYFVSSSKSILEREKFASNKLFKTMSIDEDNRVTYVFKDRQGKMVLKRVDIDRENVDTYYIYDEFGRVRVVLQPMAIKEGVPINQELLDQYAFQYNYDHRGRLTASKKPGADWVYMAYDRWDRLVATQDGNQRDKEIEEFSYVKYDGLNRPITTGIYTESESTNISTIRNELTQTSFERAEVPSQDVLIKDYTSYLAWPYIYHHNIGPNTFLTKTYYDNYDFLSLDDYKFRAELGNSTHNKETRGQITGTWARILHTNEQIVKANYFDEYKRPIQVFGSNVTTIGNSSGSNRLSTQYGLYGEVEKTRETVTYKRPNGVETHKLNKTFTYDHRGRLLTIASSINGKPEQELSRTTYNFIGQPLKKELHKGAGDEYLQTVDFKYNARGWLTQINDPYNFNSNDLFGLKLYYNNPRDNQATAQFNGNVAQMVWKVKNPNLNTNVQRSYSFAYDRLNRMTRASYKENNHDGTIGGLGRFNISCQYDYNGNILSLNRKGFLSDGTYGDIDNLTYHYLGNVLKAVNDGVEDYLDPSSFRDNGAENGNASNHEYFHDKNGTLTGDNNKGIGYIGYNHLNQPQNINIGFGDDVAYTYDGNGNKLEKIISSGFIGVIAKTQYLGSFEFMDDKLRLIHTEEGRAVPMADGTYEYQTFLKDHLGNTRLVFKKKPGAGFTPELLHENNYYPFGSKFAGTNNSYQAGLANHYLFGGKEYESYNGLNWHDFGARQYDAQLGRWHVQDPLADKAQDWTAYRYGFNNPMRFTDPTGMFEAGMMRAGKNASIQERSAGKDTQNTDGGGDYRFQSLVDAVQTFVSDATTVIANAEHSIDIFMKSNPARIRNTVDAVGNALNSALAPTKEGARNSGNPLVAKGVDLPNNESEFLPTVTNKNNVGRVIDIADFLGTRDHGVVKGNAGMFFEVLTKSMPVASMADKSGTQIFKFYMIQRKASSKFCGDCRRVFNSTGKQISNDGITPKDTINYADH